MVTKGAAVAAPPQRAWSDDRLVRGCLNGDEDAWAALVDKYKNLIYSVPIKQGFTPEEAAEIFQAVCVGLLSELPNLRKPRALAAWLIRTTSHKCFHARREARRFVGEEAVELEHRPDAAPLPPDVIAGLEREQTLREALAALPARCRQLVHLLFYETPARPYAEVARELGIATGSIGFIRMRCLERLRRGLEQKGFE